MRRFGHSSAKNSLDAAGPPRLRARRCIVLGDLTESLLQAYEYVARHAYQKFLARGAVPGGELDDWLAAERELLAPITVDFQESEGFIHALAAAPCFSRARVDVSIEPRWLAILAENESPAMAEEPRPSSVSTGAAARDSTAGKRSNAGRATAGKPVEGEREGSDGAGTASRSASSDGSREADAEVLLDDAPPLQAFCIVQLPAAVIPKDSIAVIADGLLGIRMPKAAKAAKAAPATSLDHHAAR